MGRSVLLLQSADSQTDLRPALSSGDWDAELVQYPKTLESSRLLNSSRFAVGIAVIDRFTRFDVRDLFDTVSRTDMEWVAVTTPDAPRDTEVAKLLASGFFDYHTLPVDAQRLLQTLGHAFGKSMLRRRLDTKHQFQLGRYGMVGLSPPMVRLYKALDKISVVDAPVLIQGESGTGKEGAALAIHGASKHRHSSFVTVNCGAIPLALVQTELFGHEKGSFTGAHRRKIGSVEAAAGGTIFLDEIGDLPLEAQASLLRFLQESTFTRVGATTPIRIETRVIAASHVDLEAAVKAGRFREDLFYRLNVLRIDVPPLRDRGDDIRLIAESIFEASATQRSENVQGFSPEAVQVMLEHSWPGNVRELINRVRKAMIMCEGRFIGPADLGLAGQQVRCCSISLARARQLNERDIVESALERNTRNMAATARELGVSRVTLYRLVRRLGIQR